MNALREDPRRALILGAGQSGCDIFDMLLEEDLVTLVGVFDPDPDAPCLAIAAEHNIPVFTNVEEALNTCAPCVAFNMTGNEMVEAVASEILGAGGVIGGMEANLIWHMVSNLKKAKDELRFQASHDELTGLYNRRHMMEQLQQGLSEAVRYKHPYSIVVLDIDLFKQVNDEHGHAVGDLALTEMARMLRESVRDADIPGRWGGEEFLVLLPHTDLDGAARAAWQWLENITSAPLVVKNAGPISLSFSGSFQRCVLSRWYCRITCAVSSHQPDGQYELSPVQPDFSARHHAPYLYF